MDPANLDTAAFNYLLVRENAGLEDITADHWSGPTEIISTLRTDVRRYDFAGLAVGFDTFLRSGRNISDLVIGATTILFAVSRPTGDVNFSEPFSDAGYGQRRYAPLKDVLIRRLAFEVSGLKRYASHYIEFEARFAEVVRLDLDKSLVGLPCSDYLACRVLAACFDGEKILSDYGLEVAAEWIAQMENTPPHN